MFDIIFTLTNAMELINILFIVRIRIVRLTGKIRINQVSPVNDRYRTAGILARRIVSWVTLDDVLEKGERYGLIRFGSCTEVVMPKSVEVMVKKGDRVKGGETIIGRVKSDDI